ALRRAGAHFGERLYPWQGNLLYLTEVNEDSVPFTWPLAKRRYVQRCVRMYGDTLSTAGTHVNVSLPEPLLAWDFMHKPASERRGQHLDDYKNRVYITATRLMRAFAALFIATTASTPFQAQERDGRPVVVLTEYDSVRNLTFPNPTTLDVPDLYRSHQDYVNISYELVRSGARFGNNNWTPVRARSRVEPVERLIAVTDEQLRAIYDRGLYAMGEVSPVEEMAQQIEMENLMARINIPMARVEIRTDDGSNPVSLDVANLALKQLLLMRFYADPDFARSFRYDAEDIARARRNEERAARRSLEAEIENPLTGKPVAMRAFLRWTLEQVMPLAQALGWEDFLQPLVEMGEGAPNTAQLLRARLLESGVDPQDVPVEVLRQLAEAREAEVAAVMDDLAARADLLSQEGNKLGVLLQLARHDARHDPDAPIRFRPREEIREVNYPNKTAEIVDLASRLIRIPSVTVGEAVRLDDVQRAATLIYDYLRNHGLEVRYFNHARYPAILAGFPGGLLAPVMLCGHFDVVAPEPDDSQFEPRLEGDYLWGRGAADMKTVVATYMVWMKDALKAGPPFPPVNLLLVGNEETGEQEAMGTPHVLAALQQESGYAPKLFIAGERTEVTGKALWGEVCIQNRGIMRFDVVARGVRGHTGVAGAGSDLSERLLAARQALGEIMKRHLTLSSEDGWQSQVRFPFIQVGSPGVYNILADYGVLGVEIRPIPQDDIAALFEEVKTYCAENGLELENVLLEAGIACDPENPYLKALLRAVETASGATAPVGRKLAGTSARFAPGGQGVVWGESGIGPHSAEERHYIPSIEPYYRALDALGKELRAV
ncbi:MAG: M20/M25/M40 family metallo-hydrolase, partial [Anaerolineae bacterium]